MPDINISEINVNEVNIIDIIKAIIKFENKQVTPENINKIKVIETHISLIYLTEKFAYKQKKKVNFGFLDYMSLEKRKFYCRKELSLNRRSCSGIYLDMPELRLKNDGSLLLGYKKGKIIDHLVRMKRVLGDKFLNSILANSKKRHGFDYKGDNNKCDEGGRLRANTCEDKAATETAYADFNVSPLDNIDNILQKTAKRIYLFHKNANSSKRISMFGKVDILKDNFDDNYSAVYNFVSEEKGLNFDALNYLCNQNNQNNQSNQSNRSNLNNLNKLSNQNNQNNLDNPSNPSNLNKLNNIKNIFCNFIDSEEFGKYIKLRVEKGFIKDCHGDLRMEHIVIGDISKINGICIMDCVEFSEKLRFQDTYLDFAFLLMDMEYNGYFYESVKIFEYYKNCFSAGLINLFREFEFKVILIYKLYRALVRCKISVLRLDNESKIDKGSKGIDINNNINDINIHDDINLNNLNKLNKLNKLNISNSSNSFNEAVNYFNLASFYAKLLEKPIIIMNIGLPGSGKTALSFLLSRYLNASLFISDKIRKELFASKDLYLYDKSISQKVYEYIFEESKRTVELKKSAIMDATFLEEGHRKIFIDYFIKNYCNFIVIYSKIDKDKESVIIERLKNRRTASDFNLADRPEYFNYGGTNNQKNKDFNLTDYSDYSDADEEIYLKMKKTLDEPVSQPYIITVDASMELKDRFNFVLNKLTLNLNKNN
ncbi:MAG: AAA family ATPase [Deltaproteobacteria bacterium]|nr:AAA family ATPase [Deltaproteobacteria bacterium]